MIPARGGSKGLPRKNLRPVLGRPLIAYAIESALGAMTLDRVIVSTDSEEIAAVAREAGANVPFLRPAELATDGADTLAVVQHALSTLRRADGYQPAAVALLEPTSPLRTAGHIDAAVSDLLASGADSVVGVTEAPHHYHPYKLRSIRGERLFRFMDVVALPARRQDLPPLYAVNSAIYVTRTDVLLRGSIYGEVVRPFLMPKHESVDIDDEFDLAVAEALLLRREAAAAPHRVPAC